MEIVRKLLQLQRNILKYGFPCALVFIFAAAISAEVSHGASSAAVVVRQHNKTDGFLSSDTVPDSVRLLPPPPASGSTAYAADEEAYRKTRKLQGTPRWEQAADDADLTFPAAAEQFSCALGVRISAKETPRLYQLLERTESDVSLATMAAKGHCRRLRPYIWRGWDSRQTPGLLSIEWRPQHDKPAIFYSSRVDRIDIHTADSGPGSPKPVFRHSHGQDAIGREGMV